MAEELPNDVTKEIVSIKENLLKVMRDLQFGQITVECLQKVAEIKTEFFGCLNVLQVSTIYIFKYAQDLIHSFCMSIWRKRCYTS